MASSKTYRWTPCNLWTYDCIILVTWSGFLTLIEAKLFNGQYRSKSEQSIRCQGLVPTSYAGMFLTLSVENRTHLLNRNMPCPISRNYLAVISEHEQSLIHREGIWYEPRRSGFQTRRSNLVDFGKSTYILYFNLPRGESHWNKHQKNFAGVSA